MQQLCCRSCMQLCGAGSRQPPGAALTCPPGVALPAAAGMEPPGLLHRRQPQPRGSDTQRRDAETRERSHDVHGARDW